MRDWKKRERKEQLEGFKCSHCNAWVPVNEIMGTANRNHCTLCLWSKHVDLEKPGDRESECRAGMEPIGLTFKKEGTDKWGLPKQGELMLIHRCTQDGKLSINRVASDDNLETILVVFRGSQSLDEEIRKGLIDAQINLLSSSDEIEVKRQLYGTSTTS